MPLYPLAMRSFDLRGYDVVITSSSAFAKGVRVPPSALHLCYCYTPMRWAWSFDRYVDRLVAEPLGAHGGAAHHARAAALGHRDRAQRRPLRRHLHRGGGSDPRDLRARERRRVPAGGRRALPPRPPRRATLPRRLAAQRVQADRPRRARLHHAGAAPRRRRRRPGARDAPVDRRPDGALHGPAHRPRGDVAVRALPRTHLAGRGGLRPHAPRGERRGSAGRGARPRRRARHGARR